LTQMQVLVCKGHLDFSGGGLGSGPWLFLGLDKLVFLHPHDWASPDPQPWPPSQMLKSDRRLRFLQLLLLSLGLAQGMAGQSTRLAWPSPLPAWL
jgi:hypothetical protein